jgi:hypothetical protein
MLNPGTPAYVIAVLAVLAARDRRRSSTPPAARFGTDPAAITVLLVRR